MTVVTSTCTRRDKNRIKIVYVELWDGMSMQPYCHTELVQSGQKYDLGWKLVPIYNSGGGGGRGGGVKANLSYNSKSIL